MIVDFLTSRTWPKWAVRLKRVWPIVLGLVLVELAFVAVVSACKSGPWPTYMDYYDLLAEGFRAGHLYLSLAPSPELIAAPNPLDEAYAQYWLSDASYHGGHFYFYWGPLPALLQAAAKSLLRVSRSVGDQYLVFGFFSLAALASMLLLNQMRARLFPRLPPSLLVLAFVACGSGTPVPYLLASTSVYAAAISGGQAFLVLGLLFAFTAIHGPTLAFPRPSKRMLLLAGFAWGAALACRASLLPAVLLLIGITTILARSADGTAFVRRFSRDAFYLALPVALFCGGLLVFNKLRFDEWFEMGVGKQMTTWHFRFSTRFFATNLHQYFLRPPHWTCRFPYAVVPYGMPVEEAVPAWIPARLTTGYVTPEPVAGLAWALPLIWGIPLAVAGVIGVIRQGRRPAATHHGARWNDPDRRRLLLWCVLAFVIMAGATLVAPLGLYMATMRYAGDAFFGLSLLGTLGLWMLHDRATGRWKRILATGLGVTICLATIVVGLLLGYQGYARHFAQFNPALVAQVHDLLSLCRPGR